VAVACAGEDAIYIFAGDGTGALRKVDTLPTGANPHGLAAADLNADGFMDLVVSARSSAELGVFLGYGKGKFAPLPAIRTGQDIIALAPADFDRDGKIDVALVSASHHRVALLRGDGKGGFTLFSARAAAK